MRRKIFGLISIAASLALFLSACGGGAQPTPDVAAISTVAAQTVEARFTQQAAAVTATPLPPTETSLPTATAAATPTTAAAGGTGGVDNTGKPCYTMTFLGDVSVSDGMIIAPGTTFTKTWRVRNDGNCVWDSKYTVVFDKGDNLSTATRYPLTKSIYPGDTFDISIPMTAPASMGDYSGYWHILTPFGGYMGVGSYNQDLAVTINVSTKPQRDFGVVSVVYDWNRQPNKGCGPDGAVYNFQATITVNSPGDIEYRWDRTPPDGDTTTHTLKFASAGSKTVYFTWSMVNGKIQNIDRQVWLTTVVGTQETNWGRTLFYFTCSTK